MSLSLPERPDLEQLRKQAKDLLKAHRHGDASVCPLLRHLRRFAKASDTDILKAGLTLAEAQRALAKEYGFADWAAMARQVRGIPADLLARHVQKVSAYVQRFPDRIIALRGTPRSTCSISACDKEATIHVTEKVGGKFVARDFCQEHGKGISTAP